MPYTYEQACEYFKEYGCKMLTEEKDYKAQTSPVKWECKCGSICDTKEFRSYTRSKTHLCKKCGYEKRKDNNIEKYGVSTPLALNKYTYEFVKNYYEEQGCELISTEYIGANEKLTYKCKCGNINTSAFADFKNKNARCRDCGKKQQIETNLAKYGFVTPLKNEKVKEKIRNTTLVNYGVINISQSEEIKQKKVDKALKKYGVENISQSEEIKEKKRQTTLKNYGFEYYFQSDEGKEKIKQSNISKYGFEYPAQNAEVLYKILIQRCKDYKLPSGKIIKLDGFENKAMDILLKNYKEEEIENCLLKVPAIIYKMDIKRVYYPDIYIKKENKIIEVKSNWTFKLDKEKNIIKKEACLKAGYKFEFWIFNKDGNLIDDEDL